MIVPIKEIKDQDITDISVKAGSLKYSFKQLYPQFYYSHGDYKYEFSIISNYRPYVMVMHLKKHKLGDSFSKHPEQMFVLMDDGYLYIVGKTIHTSCGMLKEVILTERFICKEQMDKILKNVFGEELNND